MLMVTVWTLTPLAKVTSGLAIATSSLDSVTVTDTDPSVPPVRIREMTWGLSLSVSETSELAIEKARVPASPSSAIATDVGSGNELPSLELDRPIVKDSPVSPSVSSMAVTVRV